jgi:hypothetical protein
MLIVVMLIVVMLIVIILIVRMHFTWLGLGLTRKH